MMDPTNDLDQSDPRTGPIDAGRRMFLLGLGTLLAGCASGGSEMVPGPAWDAREPRTYRPVEPYVPPVRPAREPVTAPAREPAVLARSSWSRGDPSYRLMQRMRPVRYLTVHHDAQTMYAADRASSASRIEAIRRYHRETRGWGDIGYHYVVDRGGRVWSARPADWQGAHVKNFNDANIGVVCLGNFEVQQPSRPQVEAVTRHVATLMQRYRVPVSRVRTHQEWAPTLCPGRSLQAYMVRARAGGGLA